MSDTVVTLVSVPMRHRLPNRREAFVHSLDDGRYDAAIGFDPNTGDPREVFLSGAKEGSDMAAVLADASVVISVALQHGVPAAALARSISRVPERPDGAAIRAASPIGAALDLVVDYEQGLK